MNFLVRMAMLLALVAFVLAPSPPSDLAAKVEGLQVVLGSPGRDIGTPVISQEIVSGNPVVSSGSTFRKTVVYRSLNDPRGQRGKILDWIRSPRRTWRRLKSNKEMKSMLAHLPPDDQIDAEAERLTNKDTIVYGVEPIQLPKDLKSGRHRLAAMFRKAPKWFFVRDRHGEIWKFEPKNFGLMNERSFVYSGNLDKSLVGHIHRAMDRI